MCEINLKYITVSSNSISSSSSNDWIRFSITICIICCNLTQHYTMTNSGRIIIIIIIVIIIIIIIRGLEL